jgi:hypothetical protein
MLVLHDEFRDDRPGAVAPLRLALTPPQITRATMSR